MFIINDNAYTDSIDDIEEFNKKLPDGGTDYKIIPVSELMAQSFE